MTEQQRELLLKALQEQAARNAASPQVALEFLVATGTYTKDGILLQNLEAPVSKKKSEQTPFCRHRLITAATENRAWLQRSMVRR